MKKHGIGGISHDGRDNGLEFYATPPRATSALLQVDDCGPFVWECACGDGAISEVLLKHNKKVISTDIEERGYGMSGIDFLKFPTLIAPEIITNPPFSLATQFIEHGFSLGAERITLLLKLTFLEGKSRKSLLEKHLARVHVFSSRLTLWKGGHPSEGLEKGGMMAYIWAIFLPKVTQKATIDFI